jgi:hypothetical protein
LKFVLQEDQVLGQRLAAPQPDPRLRDVRVRVERTRGATNRLTTVVVDAEQVRLDEDMLLHLVDLGLAEACRAIDARLVSEVGGDLRDVGAVRPEPLIGMSRPALLNVGVEQVGRPNTETT